MFVVHSPGSEFGQTRTQAPAHYGPQLQCLILGRMPGEECVREARGLYQPARILPLRLSSRLYPEYNGWAIQHCSSSKLFYDSVFMVFLRAGLKSRKIYDLKPRFRIAGPEKKCLKVIKRFCIYFI